MATSSISSPEGFREEARFQRFCAVCGAPGPYDAHHVLSKQHLKRRGRVDLLWDPRNALRLCIRCHERCTNAVYKIPTEKLTWENICFIWDVLGVAGQNYLERYYTGIDRRFTLHREGACPSCQK